MKITCTISGVSYNLQNFMGNAKQRHPVFSLSIKQLESNILSNIPDKRLILLAVLNAYPHIIKLEFTDITVITEATALQLRRAYNMLASVCADTVVPKFKCNTDNINNLKHYLDSLDEVIKTSKQRKSLSNAIVEVTALKKTNKSYPLALTRWLFNAVAFPNINITGANRRTQNGRVYETIIAYWKAMFKDIVANPKNIFCYPRQDFEELRDYIFERLENDCHNSLYVYSVIAQVERELKSVSIEHDNLIGSIKDTVTKNNYSELKGTEEPNELNFLTRTDYLIALAKWKLAQRG